ncbi:MAG TPA: ATP-binding protein [Longimicrobiaceae bacterium]|nr:ATP-binding protein [Longimicrobiaceae bacterium]
MIKVLKVPPTLDDEAFDDLVRQAEAGSEGGWLVDARHVRWADPYGMIGLLALGKELAGEERPALELPESPEVLSYLGRMGFYREAERLYEMHGPAKHRDGGSSSVLLEITPINSHEDVHGVIDHVQERAGVILTEKLGYSRGEAGMFSMILSEVCQNIIEHAESGGWVGIQTYNWVKRLGRPVVMIAVMDLGVGFCGSLGNEHSMRFGDTWGDATALEAAFMHGVTRFRDPGRGQGLKQIRSRVARWGGKVAIRSGTARIARTPEWDEGPAMEQDLAPFPGSQILIILPART